MEFDPANSFDALASQPSLDSSSSLPPRPSLYALAQRFSNLHTHKRRSHQSTATTATPSDSNTEDSAHNLSTHSQLTASHSSLTSLEEEELEEGIMEAGVQRVHHDEEGEDRCAVEELREKRHVFKLKQIKHHHHRSASINSTASELSPNSLPQGSPSQSLSHTPTHNFHHKPKYIPNSIHHRRNSEVDEVRRSSNGLVKLNRRRASLSANAHSSLHKSKAAMIGLNSQHKSGSVTPQLAEHVHALYRPPSAQPPSSHQLNTFVPRPHSTHASFASASLLPRRHSLSSQSISEIEAELVQQQRRIDKERRRSFAISRAEGEMGNGQHSGSTRFKQLSAFDQPLEITIQSVEGVEPALTSMLVDESDCATAPAEQFMKSSELKGVQEQKVATPLSVRPSTSTEGVDETVTDKEHDDEASVFLEKEKEDTFATNAVHSPVFDPTPPTHNTLSVPSSANDAFMLPPSPFIRGRRQSRRLSTMLELQEGLEELQRQVQMQQMQKEEEEDVEAMAADDSGFESAEEVEALFSNSKPRRIGRSMLHNRCTVPDEILNQPEQCSRTILFMLQHSTPSPSIARSAKRMSLSNINKLLVQEDHINRVRQRGRRNSSLI